MKVSIIIPCLNEEHYVAKLLCDLERQTHNDFEVILMDADSIDKTLKVVKPFRQSLPLTIIEHAPKGVANARNIGADHAVSDWLLFMDADVTVTPNFLTTFLEAARKHEVDAASSKFTADSHKKLDHFGAWLHFRYMKLFERTSYPLAPGGCILIRRDIHHKVSGFDPRVMSEDFDYITRCAAAGASFKFITDTSFKVSVRRYEKDGRIRLFLKLMVYEAHRLIYGK
ncbi:MAG TPA: glycosyltransferase, partial [Candidatus Saccharimonadia bacterium]